MDDGLDPKTEDEPDTAVAVLEDPPLPAPLQRPEPVKKSRCRCPSISLAALLEVIQEMPRCYCQTLAQRPWLCVTFWMIVVIVVLPLAWTPIVVDTDVNAYRRADGNASRAHLAYLDSLSYTRAVADENALSERRTMKLELLYEAKDGNIFGEAVLRDIRAFEQALRSLEGWSKLCDMSEPLLKFQCSPGESLGNYVWPTRLDDFLTSGGFFRLQFDGTAQERLPLDAVIAYLQEGLAAPHDLRIFLPMSFSGGSKLLRSVFGFTAPSLDDADFQKAWQDFVENELYSALKQVVLFTRRPEDPNSWDNPPAMRIYFRGDVLDDHEVIQALTGDMLLAIGPLILSLLLAWLKFRSAFLAFAATSFLCLTVLLAYVILPVAKVSLASFLGVFMMFGLGFSSFFRMHELWRRSRREATEPWERLLYLHKAAGREMLPVVCTALCYYLLMTSTLVPLREFGVFIGTSMLFAVLFAVLCFVPLLLIHEESLRPCLRRRPKVALVLEPSQLKPNWQLLASKIMVILRRPKPLLGGTALVVFICFVAALAVTASQPYPALPEVFPPDHHREAGRPLLQGFAPASPAEQAAPQTTRMCQPGRNLSSCALHWCDLASTPNNNLSAWPTSQAAPCSCYGPSGLATSCSNITVSLHVTGSRATALSQEEVLPQVQAYLQQHFSDSESMETASVSSRRLQSVVLEDWPTGATHVDPVTELPEISFGFATARSSTSTCYETHICYCSPKSCINPTGFQKTPTDLSLPALSTSESVTTSSSQSTTEVVVVYGIEAVLVPLLELSSSKFDTTFDPASPWAQRAMLRVCEELPQSLQVIQSQCWIRDFRAWLYNRGQKFPVERFLDFHSTLKEFLLTSPSATSAMWFNAGGNLTATALTFQVTPTEKASDTLKQRDLWVLYIDGLNADASATAANAWATSQAWVDAEALNDALGSAWQVLLAVIGTVFLVGLFYVLDIELVLALILVAFCIATVLIFFFFCICGWSFGPWELTILTVFLSYSVEPAFHIGHDFINPGLPEALRAEKPVDAPTSSATGDGLSDASDVNPKGKDSPEEALERSIHLVAKNLVSNSLKLLLCGMLLAPSHLRIFARLGAISIMMPLLVVPSVLLVYPAIILASQRQRREPDLLVLGKAFIDKISWLWT